MGGAVGGLAALALVGGVIYFYTCRKAARLHNARNAAAGYKNIKAGGPPIYAPGTYNEVHQALYGQPPIPLPSDQVYAAARRTSSQTSLLFQAPLYDSHTPPYESYSSYPSTPEPQPSLRHQSLGYAAEPMGRAGAPLRLPLSELNFPGAPPPLPSPIQHYHSSPTPSDASQSPPGSPRSWVHLERSSPTSPSVPQPQLEQDSAIPGDIALQEFGPSAGSEDQALMLDVPYPLREVSWSDREE